MKISLLAEHPYEVSKIATWYFEEWASKIPNTTVEMVREDIARKAKNRDIPLNLVAHDKVNLVGTLELKLRENKHYPDYKYWVGGVYVPSEFRGNGIAKNLLNKAKEIAVSCGVVTLYLECESHNVSLYSSQDFKALHQSTSHHRETIIMKWCATT
jgi:putative hydrolase of the HAD superfamily